MRRMGAGSDTESLSSETELSSGDEDKENQSSRKRKCSSPAQIRRSKRRRLEKTPSGQLLQALEKAQEEDRQVRQAEQVERRERDDRLINIFEKSCEAQRVMQKEIVDILAASLKQNE